MNDWLGDNSPSFATGAKNVDLVVEVQRSEQQRPQSTKPRQLTPLRGCERVHAIPRLEAPDKNEQHPNTVQNVARDCNGMVFLNEQIANK